MGFKEGTGYCNVCHRQVLARAETPNHILHFLITIFTCGLWVIPWILLSLTSNNYRCTNCGSNRISA